MTGRLKRKGIMLIADGLGDRPVDELNGKTPLEYARTPVLDELCRRGMTGLVHPYRPGARCGTDWGHLCLFGYDPEPYYTGRGSIEAYSAGMTLKLGDVAFRGNLATVDQDLKVIDRRSGRISDPRDIAGLVEDVNGLEVDGCRLILKPLTEHRLAMVIRGSGLGWSVPDTDPGTAREGEAVIRPQDLKDAGNKRTADILWKFQQQIHRIWEKSDINRQRVERGLLPANFILTRGCGKAMVLPPFTDRYPGARVAVIAGDSTITGIGRMCGFDGYREDGFTGGFDTDHMGKARLAVKLLKDYDLVVVHVKGTDLCGHDNLPYRKAEIIEKVDRMFSCWLEQIGEEDCYYGMTADHSTPCCQREHSADPVPSFLAGPGVRRDGVELFGERACAGGILNQYTGSQFMATIMDYLELTRKYGA
ncbi:2,3-bisphosphoglycerate-independent phosphoglycerate mutase [Enterocloster citroniae]